MTDPLIAFDQQQRALALDPCQSFVVQAPAGSGKTELLIQRYLTLLAAVKKPEEIIAITFTKKSANEMRARVIKALQAAKSAPQPETAHEQLTWRLANQVLQRDENLDWHLIDNPNQLHIQTIDSLCVYLTSQLPLLSQFGAAPAISEHPELLYREAAMEVLSHIEEGDEWSDAIARLLLHLDNDLNKLLNLLINLLEKRDQWQQYLLFGENEAGMRSHLEKQIASIVEDRLNGVVNLFPSLLSEDVLAIARFAADNLTALNKDSEIRACQSLMQLPGASHTERMYWAGIARLLLTDDGTWRKKVIEKNGFPALASLSNSDEKNRHQQYRQHFLEVMNRLNTQEALRAALEDVLHLPDSEYLDTQWEILQSLLAVLKILSAQLRVTFRQHGVIDFIENAQAALNALGSEENPTDLALALDYQISHLLVDEFQDTSFTQYRLLHMLTLGWMQNDGRTLFVVGDPMQSIYRFRQAEVGLFIRMQQHGIGHLPLTPLRLCVNFRSTPTIVEWNNTHFCKIFPSFSDIATGAVSYSESISSKKNSELTGTKIDVRGFLDTDDQAQAEAVVQVIQSTTEAHPQDTIAILVKSRSHLSAIIPALKKAAIRYQAVDIDPLEHRQIIQDLFSLTCALLHPADHIAWLSLLRAPWCGLSLDDLLVIVSHERRVIICEQLQENDVIEKLSQDGKSRLKRVLPVLQSALDARERVNLRNWVEQTWIALGGPATLHDESDLEDANAFFELLEEYQHEHVAVNRILLKNKIRQGYAPSHDHTALVQIMTIHTAKGLEFDTVILPRLERRNQTDDKSLLLWMERPLRDERIALLLAPIHRTGDDKDRLYGYIERQQRIKSDFETDRLLYVAATRAKKRLSLLFNTSINSKNEIRANSGSFLEKLWPFFKNRTDSLVHTPKMSAESDNTAIQRRPIQRLVATWNHALASPPFLAQASPQQQSGFYLTENRAQLIGNTVHRLLQQIALNGIAWWQDAAQPRYTRSQAVLFGAVPDEVETIVNTVLAVVHHAVKDERGQWILKSHSMAESELALTVMNQTGHEHLVIDRTFVDENNVRWIIDYKTTPYTGDDKEPFLDAEQKKHSAQMMKYYQAMQMIDQRPIRLGLYFPALPAWREWEPA